MRDGGSATPPPPNGAPAVHFKGVRHRYGATTALAGVDLTVPAGCMAGLIGPDGVGKSSLLALAAGARKIQEGRVTALGGRMDQAEHRRRIGPRIAYMPQGLGKNLYPTLSVVENVDFFGRLFGHPPDERRWRTAELLQATGLAPFAARPTAKLSGGMKQKLGLCCALIHDPDLLILDEPTTGVDPLSRRQFWELIDHIRARRPGISVLVATAYMEEAERFDWLACMDAGTILGTGSPQALKARTGATALEQAFIALLPETKRRGRQALVIPPRRVRDGDPAIEARGLTCRFGDFTAVDQVSFTIERGEIFGFLGSNGCGKTTTMKMLTGLLPATEGEARLFEHPVAPQDVNTRKRVGYMSQSFSLYSELTVRRNLELHAHLFHLPARDVEARVQAMLDRFGLRGFAGKRPDGLPLGIRQRLQLAVAVLHGPETLILDEPTSGVDPVARDAFWELLIDLSRNDGVTVFISTHFMNEAERCDRISLMHAGKVLALGAPADLIRARAAQSLEEAFVGYLEDAAVEPLHATGHETAARPAPSLPGPYAKDRPPARFSPRRMWAYAWRETLELLRDPIRLSFTLLAPMLLLIVFGYGISFDVEELSYAALDLDRSPASREYLAGFSASRFFERRPPIAGRADLERRLRSGELKVAIEIPPGFGRDQTRGARPTVFVWLDGAMPARARTTLGYVERVHQQHLEAWAAERGRERPAGTYVEVAPRFRYNPEFRSARAIVPGVIMLLLVLIPAMMTAVGVVREKELGSITNLYATPVNGTEFLLGKQAPYVAISCASFVLLLLLARFLFEVPITGSPLTLALGTIAYVTAATGCGLLISTFATTQAAAIFAAGILTTVPAISFSGMFTPFSCLSGGGRWFGLAFPSRYYQSVSLGTFAKQLGVAELYGQLAILVGFAVFFLVGSIALLRVQER